MISYLNNVNNRVTMKVIKTHGKKKVMNIDEEIKKLIENVKNQAQYKVSDDFRYGNVYESVRNETDDLFCKVFGMSIEQHPDIKNRHYLILSLLHPSLRSESTVALTAGNKAEILEYLKDSNIEKTFKAKLTEIDNNMRDKG